MADRLPWLLHTIAAGQWRRPAAVQALYLGRLADDLLGELRAEAREVMARPSGDLSVAPIVRPFGDVEAWSLYTATGDPADHSDVFAWRAANKRPIGGPAIRHLCAIPGLVNMRLARHRAGAGLRPHKARVVHWIERPRTIGLILRFHIPLVTNHAVRMVLEGGAYHFEAGAAYYFNNAAVHAAENRGAADRLHLIFDVRMTERAYHVMFGEEVPWRPHQRLEPLYVEEVGDYETKVFQGEVTESDFRPDKLRWFAE